MLASCAALEEVKYKGAVGWILQEIDIAQNGDTTERLSIRAKIFVD